MDDVTIARALHVIAIVIWIGGVAMVTTVLLPSVRRLQSAEERVAFFASVERRFAWQARGTTLLAAVTGFYMVGRLDLWSSFLDIQYWWLDAMALLWLAFTTLLFVAEPLFLDLWFEKNARLAPERVFSAIQRLHWILLVLSLITIAGAVTGSHGLSFFG
jgi:uncharacterized membrane protein